MEAISYIDRRIEALSYIVREWQPKVSLVRVQALRFRVFSLRGFMLSS
jgi:hypothetical protein